MSKQIGTPLITWLILLLAVCGLPAQDYFYDAKFIEERIHLTPSKDEVLVKFKDTITAQALTALAQDLQMDIRSENLGQLKYARLRVRQTELFNGILSSIRSRADVRAAMPVLIDQFGARRKFIPGQFTVQFVDGLTSAEMRELVESFNCSLIKEHTTKGYYTVEVLEAGEYFPTIQEFVSLPQTIFAEPEYMVSGCGSSADPLYPDQWNLNNTGQTGGTPGADINIEPAWQITTGNPFIWIAPLEYGFNLNHEDLSGQYNVTIGRDYTQDPWVPIQHNPTDHSTKICGIIAAKKGNGKGIAGIAPSCRLLPVATNISGDKPHIDCNDAVLSQKTDALNYITSRAGVGNNDRIVVSMSWSHMDADYECLYFAINSAYNAGVVLVSSTDNQGSSSITAYPSAYPQVIGVGATTHNDVRAGYSNYGASSGIEVAAPVGNSSVDNIISTIGENDYGHGNLLGTSFAAPQVAALAALILSIDANISTDEVRAIIASSADKVGGYTYNEEGWSEELGYGRINAYAALQNTNILIDPPATPALFRVRPLRNHPKLSWSANTEWDLDGYLIERKEGISGSWRVPMGGNVSASATSFTDREIFILETNPDIVFYRMRAYDTRGNYSGYTSTVSIYYNSFPKAIQDTTLVQAVPASFALAPNHPNPFNPATTIRYDLPEASRVSLVIYDIIGQEVYTYTAVEEPGYRQLVWDGKDQGGRLAPAGIYICRLAATSIESHEHFTASRKMVLLR